MKPARALTFLLLSAFVWVGSSPVKADCAAPEMNVDSGKVVDGTVTVTGRSFMDGCQDSGSCTIGCGGQTCDYGPSPKPLTNIELRLQQRRTGAQWSLGTVDADRNGRFSIGLSLPEGIENARYFISTRSGVRTDPFWVKRL